MKILMCRPDYYGIEYEINPWMNIKSKVTHNVALQQWEELYKTILTCNAEVNLVQPVGGWPDMVFTANAGLAYQNKIILSRFKHSERQGESPYFQNWFLEAGYEVINPLSDNSNVYAFEGAGDALLAGDKIFAGFGFRTDHRFYKQATYLDQSKLIYCELTDPYFYHLDTCFCPLTDKLALWYPAAFTQASQKNMAAHIDLLEVTKEEAKRFACNAVVIDKHIILPSNCPNITTLLNKNKFITHNCDMTEYLKSGGACKCLTLRLD